MQLVVQLIDVNDNAPQFSLGFSSESIRENHELGAIVTIVAAEDNDQGTNAALSYSITQGNAGGRSLEAADLIVLYGWSWQHAPMDHLPLHHLGGGGGVSIKWRYAWKHMLSCNLIT